MKTAELRVPTPDGPMRTYTARPDGEGPFPAIILYSNVRGLSDDLRWCARKYAQAGFYCAAPDVYHRLGDLLINADSTHADALKVKAAAYAHALTPFQTSTDAAALLDFLDDDLAVGLGPKGVVGHCMGGYFAPLLAGLYPDRIRATASINPVKLLNDAADNPRQYLDRIRGGAYFGFAELDKNTPPEMIATFTELLDRTCTAEWTVHTHQGERHGFAVPGRPSIWSKHGAADVFRRTIDLFDRHLRAESVAA
jgi:carboxymethylenebutenolidase